MCALVGLLIKSFFLSYSDEAPFTLNCLCCTNQTFVDDFGRGAGKKNTEGVMFLSTAQAGSSKSNTTDTLNV